MTRPAVVFGDVHGEAVALEALIHKIRTRFGLNVDIYSVGDLVDRGPNSKGVLEICVREGIQGIVGNHEIWLHRYFATGEFDDMALHSRMNGKATLRSYGLEATDSGTIERRLRHLVPQPHKDFILGLPIWRKIEVDGEVYRLVHAGVKNNEALMHKEAAYLRAKTTGDPAKFSDALCNTIAELNPAYMMWQSPNLKDPDLFHFPDGSTQIFGHVPHYKPTITPHWMAIDTGAGTRPPYTITAVILPSREIIQANRLSNKLPDKPGFHDFEG